MALWSRFPTELESDLSQFHDRSVGDWLRGEMSSRLFLVFAKHMDDHGAFKTSARRGHYTPEQAMMACAANELMSLRYSRFGGDDEPVLFRSAGQIADEHAEQEAFEAFDEDEFDAWINGGFAAVYCGEEEDD